MTTVFRLPDGTTARTRTIRDYALILSDGLTATVERRSDNWDLLARLAQARRAHGDWYIGVVRTGVVHELRRIA